MVNAHEYIYGFTYHHLRKTTTPICGTHAPMVNHFGHRHMIHLMARPTHTLAEIDILAIHEIARIESANFFEQ